MASFNKKSLNKSVEEWMFVINCIVVMEPGYQAGLNTIIKQRNAYVCPETDTNMNVFAEKVTKLCVDSTV
jgi:ribosomal protein RSM22 (predicted rRNA methylase)